MKIKMYVTDTSYGRTFPSKDKEVYLIKPVDNVFKILETKEESKKSKHKFF